MQSHQGYKILLKFNVYMYISQVLFDILIFQNSLEEIKDNRNNALQWPNVLAKRCVFLLQIEAVFLVCLIDGTNMLYSLHELCMNQLLFLSQYSAGLKLACFMIILIFIFSLTQLSLIRARRAFARLSGNQDRLLIKECRCDIVAFYEKFTSKIFKEK
jgi:hypothetical protein